MRATVADAWSLAPIAEVRLGEEVFPVPPLTFARFQRLLSADHQKVVAGLAGEARYAPSFATRAFRRMLKWAILRAPRAKRPLWWLVNRFGIGAKPLPAPSAAALVHLVIPAVPEATWREHGTQQEFARLFLTFSKAHDWGFISDAIRFGEPVDAGETMPSQTDLVNGLLAIAKATGYTVEDLTEMRVDGFYLLVEALREQRQPDVEGEIPEGIEYESGGDSSALLEMLKRAEEAGRG